MNGQILTHKQIFSVFAGAMLEKGWSQHSFSGLPKIFSKREVVTPYYCAGQLHRTGDGWYTLGGGIGVIHQEFEETWAARTENRGQQSLLTSHLLICNIKHLMHVSYVRPETLAQDMDRFVNVLDEVLAGMPQSESALKEAFNAQQLCGRPISTFSGWSQRQKFAEFQQFISRLP